MAFNENTRVKIPAMLHLTRLGVTYLSLKGATWEQGNNIFTDIFQERKIEYTVITAEEFVEEMQSYCCNLDALFSESAAQEKRIKKQLEGLSYA